MALIFFIRNFSLSSSPKRLSSPPKTPPTKWVASSTLQRRWASERIRNRRKSFNKTENDRFTRFDEKTDSLLDINRSNCRDHADFKKSFMSTNVLKVNLFRGLKYKTCFHQTFIRIVVTSTYYLNRGLGTIQLLRKEIGVGKLVVQKMAIFPYVMY